MRNAPGRIDPDAQRYQDYWRPVLDGASQRLLGRVGDEARERLSQREPRPVLLDVGAGTGAITLSAARRWPGARVLGLDASAGMLSVAQKRAEVARIGEDRLEWFVADAASLPFEDASVDVAVSSFVLQLVSDRRAVLDELSRVLRPGGLLGFVTWIAEELQMDADSEFDEVVYELELDDPESVFREPKPGDYESLEAARDELAAVGYERIDTVADRITYTWTREAYLQFKRAFDEREMFESLDEADRVRLIERVEQRWAALPDTAFTLEAPLVSALAYRP